MRAVWRAYHPGRDRWHRSMRALWAMNPVHETHARMMAMRDQRISKPDLDIQLMNNKFAQSRGRQVPRPIRQPSQPKRRGFRSSLVSTGVLPPLHRQMSVTIPRPLPATLVESMRRRTEEILYPEETKTRWVKLVPIPVDEVMPLLTQRQLLKVATRLPLRLPEDLSYPQRSFSNSGWLRWLNYAKPNLVLRRLPMIRSRRTSLES